ncbi:MAG: alpha/beta hydrolase [Chloroflexi bacterium]|nr:alpha/beta hydrolase [Chloroflexota bacterium]
MPEKQSARQPGGSLLKAAGWCVGVFAGTAAAAAGSWIAYSYLAIDHHLPLRKAIDADTLSFMLPENIRVHYYTDQSATGVPLVLIHSVNAAASSYEMAPIFNRYRAKRPVYALDLPGFGFSQRLKRDYSPRLYQETILDFLQNSVGQPADVVALSLSSEFAARAAAIQPQLFHSLALVSPTGFALPKSTRSSQRAGQRGQANTLYNFFSIPVWGRPLYDLISTKTSIRFFLQQSFVGKVPDDMVEYSYATAHQPDAEHAPLQFISGKLFTPNISETFYAKLEIPVLAVYDNDAFTSFDLLPKVAAEHPNWRLVRIAPSRGLPHFEKMDEVAQALDQFWGMPG